MQKVFRTLCAILNSCFYSFRSIVIDSRKFFNRIGGVRYTVSLMQSAKTNKDIVRTEIVIVIMCLLLLSNNTIVCLVSWNQKSLMLLISTIWYCRWYYIFQLALIRCFCYFFFGKQKPIEYRWKIYFKHCKPNNHQLSFSNSITMCDFCIYLFYLFIRLEKVKNCYL